MIKSHPPASYIRRAVTFARSITAAQHLTRGLQPGTQDVGDYNQYYMRPEIYREMAKRVDCLSLRLSCLEITATTSKLSDQDYEVAMRELQEVRKNVETTGDIEAAAAPRGVGSLTPEGTVEVDLRPVDVLRSPAIAVDEALIPQVTLDFPPAPYLSQKGPLLTVQPRPLWKQVARSA